MMILNNPIADTEPQARPFTRRFGRKERVEDFIDDRRINAATDVRHFDFNGIAILSRGDCDDAALMRSIDRICR